MRTSLLAAIVGVHAFQGTRYTVAGEVPVAQGNHHPSISPYGLFPCARRHRPDRRAAARVSGGGSPPRSTSTPTPRGMATNAERVANREHVIATAQRRVRRHPRTELLARLARVGVPAGEVRTLDAVYDWEQTRSQGLLIDVDHPVLGDIELPGPPLRFDDNAFAGGRERHLHPPLLGEHNDAVRAWLDDLDDLDDLGADGAHGDA